MEGEVEWEGEERVCIEVESGFYNHHSKYVLVLFAVVVLCLFSVLVLK